MAITAPRVISSSQNTCNFHCLHFEERLQCSGITFPCVWLLLPLLAPLQKGFLLVFNERAEQTPSLKWFVKRGLCSNPLLLSAPVSQQPLLHGNSDTKTPANFRFLHPHFCFYHLFSPATKIMVMTPKRKDPSAHYPTKI